ncbi:MAG: hypothetical protein KKG95_02925 [Candidatus Omnitrophica bacterium]|nr:hypothetical protein [Candidatus Omnitrophota bacterium]MBU1784280.1 hypothetical protein [Candidatus Omnitrophota bacterium]
MAKLAKQAWKWKLTLVGMTLMLTFGHAFSFAETVILRTTIPRQDELRVKKGVVGNRDVDGDGEIELEDGDWNYKDVELTDDNLIVGGVTNTAGGLVIETRDSDPVDPEYGRIWLRTDE